MIGDFSHKAHRAELFCRLISEWGSTWAVKFNLNHGSPGGEWRFWVAGAPWAECRLNSSLRGTLGISTNWGIWQEICILLISPEIYFRVSGSWLEKELTWCQRWFCGQDSFYMIWLLESPSYLYAYIRFLVGNLWSRLFLLIFEFLLKSHDLQSQW